jgi:hypothetical protein
MVLKMLVLSTFNHLMRLVARENFIILSRRESLKSYRFKYDCLSKYILFSVLSKQVTL